MSTRARKGLVLLGLALLLGLQLVLWLADGRRDLPGDTFLLDVAHDQGAADEEELGTPGQRADYLLLCEELSESLGPEGISRARRMRAGGYGTAGDPDKTRLLAQSDWTGEAGSSVRCQCARAVVNTPLVAKVSCDDACNEIAMHGHSHLLVYFLGKWFLIKTGEEWVS